MKTATRFLAILLTLCLVLSMGVLMVSAETSTIEYKFYDKSVAANEKGVSAFLPEGDDAAASKAAMDILQANYATNKFLPVGTNATSSKGIHIYSGTALGGNIGDNYALGINDALEGEWIAVKIKNPGTGSFDVTTQFYRGAQTKAYLNVYVLPGNTTDINSALTSQNRYASQKSTYVGFSNGANTFEWDKKLETNAEDGEYIIVFQIAEFYHASSAQTTKARMYIGGITLTGEVQSSGSEPTVPTVPTEPSQPDAPSQTGETAPIALFAMLVLISLAAVCVLCKKRKAC